MFQILGAVGMQLQVHRCIYIRHHVMRPHNVHVDLSPVLGRRLCGEHAHTDTYWTSMCPIRRVVSDVETTSYESNMLYQHIL